MDQLAIHPLNEAQRYSRQAIEARNKGHWQQCIDKHTRAAQEYKKCLELSDNTVGRGVLQLLIDEEENCIRQIRAYLGLSGTTNTDTTIYDRLFSSSNKDFREIHNEPAIESTSNPLMSGGDDALQMVDALVDMIKKQQHDHDRVSNEVKGRYVAERVENVNVRRALSDYEQLMVNHRQQLQLTHDATMQLRRVLLTRQSEASTNETVRLRQQLQEERTVRLRQQKLVRKYEQRWEALKKSARMKHQQQQQQQHY